MVLGMGGGNTVEVAVESSGTSGFMKSMGNAEGALMGLRSTALTAGAALAGIGLAGAAGIGATISQANDLETAMAEVTTLMGEGEDAAEKYGDLVADLSTRFAAQGGEVEVTQGLYQTLSAGIADAGDETEFLETAMKTAQAGLTDTETAVDTLSTVVNAYNMDAEDASDVSDVLFETVRQGKTRMDELGGTIGRVIPTAAEMGVGIEEVGASIATLTAQGQSTDQAVTAVNRTLTSLLKPTKEGAEVINDMGFESGRALVESEGLAGALSLLKEHTEDSNAEMTDVFGNVRALRGVLPLAGEASEDFAENLGKMEDSAGATDAAFEEMSDTAQFKWQQAVNQIKAATTDLGEAFKGELAPAFQTVGDVIEDATSWFRGLDDTTQSLIAKGFLAGTAFALVAGVLTLAVLALSAVAAAAVPVIAAMALISAAGAALWGAWKSNFGNIRGVTEETFAEVRALWDVHGEPLMAQIETALNNIRDFWDSWGDEISTIVEYMFSSIKLIAVTAFDALISTVRFWLAIFNGDWEEALEIAKGFFERTFERIGDFVRNWGGKLVDWLKGLFEGFGAAVKGRVNDALNLPFEYTIGDVEVGGETVFAGKTISIPALAEGGVVTRPTLAAVGEGGESEVVAPLSKLERMLDTAPRGAVQANGEVVERLDEILALLREGGEVVVQVGREEIARVTEQGTDRFLASREVTQ